MKKILVLVLVLQFTSANLIAQTQIPAGTVSGTWDVTGSPYQVDGEITVPDGETLNIDAGVTIEFQGHYRFNVLGRLLALGTEADSILFTINDTTGFSNPDTSLGGWHGVRLYWTPSFNDSSKFVYCKFEYGKSGGTTWLERNGGAMLINSLSNIKISHCLFQNNRAGGFGSGGGFQGGAIFANVCNLQIDNCTFRNNIALSQWGTGGAISYSADTSYSGSLYEIKLENNLFINNYALTRGGVYINNWADDGIYVNVHIDQCEFIENGANNYSGLNINQCNFELSNSTFKGNTAWQYAAAGGFSGGSIGTVYNCLFEANHADLLLGGWNSGGISIWSNSDVNLINCTFVNNTAAYGAGLSIGSGGSANIINSIFRGNSYNQISLTSFNDVGGTASINYSNIQDGVDSVNVTDAFSSLNWGEGNIDGDPAFLDPTNSVFHLDELSPCISAAIDSIELNGEWLLSPSDDLEGNTRPNPFGSPPDMGAFESPFGNIVGVTYHEDKFTSLQGTLGKNYPNPFQKSTTIGYEIIESSFIKLSVFDLFGKQAITVVNEVMEKGKHEVMFKSDNLSSGIYFYQLQVSGKVIETRKMQVIK